MKVWEGSASSRDLESKLTDGMSVNQYGSVIHFSTERLKDDADGFCHVS